VGHSLNLLMTNYMETTAPGGVSKTVGMLAENLSSGGHEVTVLQPNPGRLPSSETIGKYKLIRVGSESANYLYGFDSKANSYLSLHINELSPDLVHVHGYHSLFSFGMMLSIIRSRPDLPIVFSPHFDVRNHTTLAGKYLWKAYNVAVGETLGRWSDCIVACSKFEARNILSSLSVPERKLATIGHGVGDIRPWKRKSRTEEVRLIYAGYLLKGKGVQHALNALAFIIQRKEAGANLTVIGEGPYEAHLRRLSVRLGVDRHVCWMRFLPVDELHAAVAAADIFLLPSQSEAYGIVVAESLALGTPVIVANTTALSEFLIEPGCYGVGHPPAAAELGGLILDVWQQNPRVGPLSSRIRTWREVASTYEELYSEVLRRTPAR